MSRQILTTLAAAAAAFSFLSCGSPVHDDLVASLGPEPNGEHSGPLHRAGQPCLTCHSSLGPSHTEFAVAGTIYKSVDDMSPMVGVKVIFAPLDGTDSIAVQTNAVGNFYITKAKFPLAYPLHVSVAYDYVDSAGKPQEYVAQMASRIGRDGSCADCHADPAGQARFGHVYITAAAADFPK